MISFLDFYAPTNINFEGFSTVIFYFTIYSMIGWLLENSYSYVTKRKFFKPNFFLGPFKPMYGFAPVLLVYLIGPETNWGVVLLLCFFIPTFIEYVSGVFLQKLFQRQWWDYSDMPLQIHGHICLPFSLCWILLSLACLKWAHPAIESVYKAAEFLWAWIWPAVMLYFIAEFTLSIRRHFVHSLNEPESSNPLR
ncbi:putative ABC transporter permease [Neobacillus niacini]|uniref:putative ABC transporter permease n=1 Tax=Neobacillus niacini TaxID=86668 RepID=UPI002FFDCDC9